MLFGSKGIVDGYFGKNRGGVGRIERLNNVSARY